MSQEPLGVDHIMIEADFPHDDETWPDTRAIVDRQLADVAADELATITHGNVARLIRRPLPAEVGLSEFRVAAS